MANTEKQNNKLLWAFAIVTCLAVFVGIGWPSKTTVSKLGVRALDMSLVKKGDTSSTVLAHWGYPREVLIRDELERDLERSRFLPSEEYWCYDTPQGFVGVAIDRKTVSFIQHQAMSK